MLAEIMNFILMFLTFVYLSTTCCAECPYSSEKPVVVLYGNCMTIPYDKPTNKTYFDDASFRVYGALVYTVLSGMLIFNENTPQFCVYNSGSRFSFSINFDSNIKNKSATVDLVSCRSNGFWTNGKEFCIPPECNSYINNTNKDNHEELIYLSLNMNDVNALNVSGDLRLLSYQSPSDPRFIFNLTSNTSKILDTDDFLSLCSKHGSCRGGKFVQNDDILYSKGGYPTLVLKKNGRKNTIFLAVRHDSRPFVTKAKDAPCYLGNRNFSVCSSSLGTQSIRKLWEKKLPLDKEWLNLSLYASFSYKEDCKIRMHDTDTNEVFADFKGPCGRYADMKRGNWPYGKIGLYTRSMQTPLKMRYRDMQLFQGDYFTKK